MTSLSTDWGDNQTDRLLDWDSDKLVPKFCGRYLSLIPSSTATLFPREKCHAEGRKGKRNAIYCIFSEIRHAGGSLYLISFATCPMDTTYRFGVFPSSSHATSPSHLLSVSCFFSARPVPVVTTPLINLDLAALSLHIT